MLVNNAGGQFPTSAEQLTPRGWEAVVRNNLNGTFYMTREVATRAMIPQRSGAIVNVIANIARGFPGMVHTGAARAGVENMTKTLAVEWAQFDMRVNAVAPGIIQSSGIAQYPPELVDAGVRARRRSASERRGSRARDRVPGVAGGGVRHRDDAADRRRRVAVGRHLDHPAAGGHVMRAGYLLCGSRWRRSCASTGDARVQARRRRLRALSGLAARAGGAVVAWVLSLVEVAGTVALAAGSR